MLRTYRHADIGRTMVTNACTFTMATSLLGLRGNTSGWRRRRTHGSGHPGLRGALGACATADSSVAVYDRAQRRAAAPVLQVERFVEDVGARVTGTAPAYQEGGTFFIDSDVDRSAFGVY